jgi:hypothetical protein
VEDLFKLITQIVALITVLGTAIYFIGLIALCWPIYRRLTRDPSAGLYAAALVPRTVVAGQGVRIFVGFPLMAALFLLIVLSMMRWEKNIVTWVFAGALDDVLVLHQILVGSIAILVTLFFIWFVKRVRTEGLFDFFFTPLNKPDASQFRLSSIVLSALGTAVGGVLILTASDVKGTLFLALVFFFGAIALASVPDAVSIEPPLPKVRVTETTNGGEVKNYEGRLVGHSEYHWYIFEEGEDKEHVLHMIPDGNAEVICVQAK